MGQALYILVMFRPLPTTLQGSHSGFTDKQDKLLGVRGVWLIYGAVGEGNKSALTLCSVPDYVVFLTQSSNHPVRWVRLSPFCRLGNESPKTTQLMKWQILITESMALSPHSTWPLVRPPRGGGRGCGGERSARAGRSRSRTSVCSATLCS